MRSPLPFLSAMAVLLASSSLGALYADRRWILPTAGAIVVATAMGVLARSLPLPGPGRAVAGIALSICGFLCYVTAVIVPSTGIGRVVPGGGTPDALRALSDQASSDIHDLLAPVPANQGVVLFAVAGCYFTAAATDLLVSGLRRPALAGFPLFVLFTVPAALARHGAGWVPFIATSIGYLVLLHADSRAAIWRWGHPVRSAAARDRGSAAGPPDGPAGMAAPTRWSPAAAATGRRIGVVSIAGALVLPALIPIGTSNWLASARSRVGHTVTVPPLVDISTRLHDRNPTPVLIVETTHPQYLRMTALDLFNGSQFSYLKQHVGSPETLTSDLANTSFQGSTTPVAGTITAASALHERFLPLPYQTRFLQVNGDWRFAATSSTVFSTSSDTSSMSWSFDARSPSPTAAELVRSGVPSADKDLAVDLSLPDRLDPDIRALAERLGSTGPTTYAKAVAIQQYLRSDVFTYDLNGAPTGSNALSDFLFVSHTGFCQQFASAMAVLAREIGIPARVAIGFTAGTLSDGSDTYTVSTSDAHAWPELYFQGVGWVPFEPTPRGDGQAVAPAYSIPTADTTGPSGGDAPGTAADNGGTQANPLNPNSSRGATPAATPATQPASSPQAWWWVAPVIVFALILLLLPISGRARLRRRRHQRSRTGDGTEDWQEVVDTAVDLGLEPDVTASPRRLGQRLAARVDGTAADALERLALAEERRRYAPPELTSGVRMAAFADVASGSAGLRQSVPWHTRLRALLLPRSWFRRHATAARGLIARVNRPARAARGRAAASRIEQAGS